MKIKPIVPVAGYPSVRDDKHKKRNPEYPEYPINSSFMKQLKNCAENDMIEARKFIIWCKRFDCQCKSSVCRDDRMKYNI